MPSPAPRPDVCWLFLARHGATANNLARPPKLQGRRSDPPLSDDGFAQAAALAEALRTQPLAAVYASPLLRARQTAETLAGPHGVAVEAVAAFTECDVGVWEGRDWEEIARTDAEANRLFQHDPAAHPYLGGENLTQVADRAAPALRLIAERHAGQVVAIVAHNVVNRVLLAPLLHLPFSLARTIPQHNCGLNLLKFHGGKLTLVTLNSVAHLAAW